jgi:hypothetical protein
MDAPLGCSHTRPLSSPGCGNPSQARRGRANERDDAGRHAGEEEWPTTPNLKRERWYWGNPPGGDFVPAGVPGVDYVSPGYR